MAHTVTVSLDDEAKKLFDQIPRGTRSRFIRDAMVDAEMISTQSGLIEALNRKIDHMKKEAYRKDGWEWRDFTWIKREEEFEQVLKDIASSRRG